ncbi:hypothetical protein D3C78_1057180 [compost metagenome]
MMVYGINFTITENCRLNSGDNIAPSDIDVSDTFCNNATTKLAKSSILSARLKLKKTVLINKISRNSTKIAPAPDITVRSADTLFLYICPITIAGIKKYTACKRINGPYTHAAITQTGKICKLNDLVDKVAYSNTPGTMRKKAVTTVSGVASDSRSSK